MNPKNKSIDTSITMTCTQKNPRYKKVCKETKDPCKICLQTVTPNNGIRCHGACDSMVHYECLNYTPGKIRDIKAGIIQVRCPCPDCKTVLPKEIVTKLPFSCNNTMCPANNPPSCDNFDCQANEYSRCLPPRCPMPGALRSCERDVCEEYSQTKIRASSADVCIKGYDKKTSCPSPKKGEKPKPDPCSSPRNEKTKEVMQQMCKTVGDLADQLNFLMDHMK